VVFVTAGYAQLETLPVFAKNQAHVTERAIGVVFFVNSLVIVLAQLPVTKLVEGRRRMAMLALMTGFWAAAWLLVFGAGLWLSAPALCLGAGAAGLMLERRLPESVRLTPAAEIAPSPEPADAPTPEGVEAEILG